MPTPVAHALAGTGIYLLGRRRSPQFLAAVVIAACLADIDFGIGFLAGRNYHHYFTHSIGFTALFAMAAFLVSKRARVERPFLDASILALAYLSHVLLDLVSKDSAAPFGLQLFWPFSESFHISPVPVFDEIWRGTLARLFGLHNWLAVAREMLIVGPVVAAIAWFKRASHSDV